MASLVIQVLMFPLPWRIRRRVLRALLGYEIDPSARIGFSIVCSKRVRMEAGARIGHLTLIKSLTSLDIGECGLIGNLNWISGFPAGSYVHFALEVERRPALTVGRHAAITHQHRIDCTDQVSIGAFTTVAGWGSQILTHAIDLKNCRQSCAPVTIGSYCFIGTRSVILKGARLPDRSVLGAGSVLARPMYEAGTIYVGNPAEATRLIDPDGKYFSRDQGFVF